MSKMVVLANCEDFALCRHQDTSFSLRSQTGSKTDYLVKNHLKQFWSNVNLFFFFVDFQDPVTWEEPGTRKGKIHIWLA